jgi:DNA polymerase-1
MINMNSVNDIRFFFYTLLQKPVEVMTDGGTSGNKQPATDADVLDGWAGNGCVWAQRLMRYRSIAKIHGTYVVGLQQWIDKASRIHTTFKQTGAVTGRLSSADPNLMNIPRPDEDEYKIREGLICSYNCKLIVADYEQVEMRLMAHFAHDEVMIKAINDGIDIHCFTVSEMNGVPYEEVMEAKNAEKKWKKGGPPLTPRQEELLLARQGAKATGFGIIYGIGGKLLAANLTKDTGRFHSEEEGNQLIEKWLNVFPGVRAHIAYCKKQMWNKGYIQTIIGRFRRFGDLKGMSRRDRGRAERQGVNSEVQGSAADICKLAMLQMENDPLLRALGYVMMIQVHDEIVGECPDDPEVVKAVMARVAEIMENALGIKLAVKTPASVGSGYDWAHAK